MVPCRLLFCGNEVAELKAAELYKQWSAAVESDWNRMGLQKLKGRSCKWFIDIGDSTLLLFVEMNSKYPWTVQGGGNFSINAFVPEQKPVRPEDYVENIFDNVEFFSLWTEDLIERRHAANRRVYEKIRSLDRTELYASMAEAYDCTPEQAESLGLYETELEIIAMDVEEPTDVLINPPLYFYDSRDVAAWSALVTDALGVVLPRIQESDWRTLRMGEPV